LEIKGDKVKIGVEAPRNISVNREEVEKLLVKN
jgi:carbon storage regulator CsrA